MANEASRLSRRSLLNMSWQSLIVAGMARASRCFAFAKPATRGLESATADSFVPCVGKTFAFLKPAEQRGIVAASVELKLKSVSRHDNISRIEAAIPATHGKRTRESFSLLFEGHEPLGPGLHEFAHGEFKGSPVFLSQVQGAKTKGSMLYEAVFG